MESNPKFHLGIVMAGAVSAGAYTAGVMDYLLETFTLWEEKKEENRRILAYCEGDMEKALKLDYDPSIPMHEVVIEVMAGASAGGMTASISTLSLFEGLKFYSEIEREVDESPKKKRFLEKLRLYDAWVNLNDFPQHREKEKISQQRATFLQMLDTSDIKKKVPSLLNSSPIEGIAKKLRRLHINRSLDDYPFISNDLDLILTVCSLKGIPVDINFDSRIEEIETPGLRMYVHKGTGHFKFGKRTPESNEKHIIYLNIDPISEAVIQEELPIEMETKSVKQIKTYGKSPKIFGKSLEDLMKEKEAENLESEHEGIEALLDASIASGAFPIGLKPKELTVGNPIYIRSQIERLFGIDPEDPNVKVKVGNEPFKFMAIDGGTINNEPIGEVDRILRERMEATQKEGCEMANYGILMIDPFPNVDEKNSLEEMRREEKEKSKIFSIEQLIPRIVTAIRRQAMVKEGDIRDGFKGTRHTRGLIRPSKPGKEGWNAIACGSLEGFGGFFHLSFRKHDFELGRRNCQSFLRKHFSIREDKFSESPIATGWKAEGIERFKMQKESGKGDFYLPIIPDVRMEKNKEGNDPSELNHPGDVCIPASEVMKLRSPISKRIYAVICGVILSLIFSKKAKKSAEAIAEEKYLTEQTNKILNKNWRFRVGKWFHKIVKVILIILAVLLSPLIWGLIFLTSRMLTSQVVLPTIMKDFYRKELIE